MPEHLQVVVTGGIPQQPRPDVAYVAAHDRPRDTDRRIEHELARIRAERRAADSPRYGMSAFEEAKLLLDQHDGNLHAAMAEALRRYGRTNGHHPAHADERGLPHQRPAIEHSRHDGRILGVR